MPKAVAVIFCALIIFSAATAQAYERRSFPPLELMNQRAEKYLDVKDLASHDGASVQIWSRSGQNNQRWTFEPTGRGVYHIRDLNSGKCLDVPRASRRNGARVQIWSCNRNRQQLWVVEPVGRDWSRIRNLATNKCLDVRRQGTWNGARVQQWDCTGAGNQLWSAPQRRIPRWQRGLERRPRRQLP